ncbi:membrane protein insertion efficiency factor YidD [bacterium CPR1]|nr:membrane protein insertion efficiency factor YidD [bacterium CPR1]
MGSGDSGPQPRDDGDLPTTGGAVCATGSQGSDSERTWPIRTAEVLIRMYQRVSRHTPAMCRFHPTCSEYTRQAVVKYGVVRGSWMGFRRILRCHPWHPGGSDPVS